MGPLDEVAARKLAREPIEALGIEIRPDRVDLVLEQTGCRPNLIAKVCDAALGNMKLLGPRVIGKGNIEAVLDMTDERGRYLVDSFADLRNTTTPHEKGRVLDNMVMAATATRDRFAKAKVEANLEDAGVAVMDADLRESLARLQLAYVVKRAGNAFHYPVPLVRTYLEVTMFGDLEAELARHVRDYRRLAAQVS